MGKSRQILICNGRSDPFVSQKDLDIAKRLLEPEFQVSILQFEEAKHGFTNPAQAWNENDAFDYNEAAAKQSWDESVGVIKRQLNC